MAQRARELKAEARRTTRSRKAREAGEEDVRAKIAEMPEPDRSMAEAIHELIKEQAPELWAKTWYGMPAYALDNKVVCFFQSAATFKARYASFGFNDTATLDDGDMWPTAFALRRWTPDVAETLAGLIRRAVHGAL